MDLTQPPSPPTGWSERFNAQVELDGPVNPVVRVEAALAERLRPGRRPLPVIVRINDLPDGLWRTNLMPVADGGFLLFLHTQMRKQSGIAVGERVSFELWFDEDYRNGPQHPMPAWFEQALVENPRAAANWARLSPSRQKELLRYLAPLRSPAAIDRNRSRALHVLAGNTGRYMGRDWVDGR